MRRAFIKGMVALAVAGAFSAQAATATLTAGSAQTVTLVDPKGSGTQVMLSVPSGGMARIDFSNAISDIQRTVAIGGAVGMFNVTKSNWSASVGSVNEKRIRLITTGREHRGYISLDSYVSEMSINMENNRPIGLKMAGVYNLITPYIDGTAEGGRLSLSNMRVDLSRRQIIADVGVAVTNFAAGNSLGPESKYYDVVFWTFDAPVGPIDIPASALASASKEQLQALQFDVLPNGRGGFDLGAKIILPKLRASTQALQIFNKLIGGPEMFYADSYNSFVNAKPAGFGDMTLNLRYTTQAPAISCSP